MSTGADDQVDTGLKPAPGPPPETGIKPALEPPPDGLKPALDGDDLPDPSWQGRIDAHIAGLPVVDECD